MSRSLYLCRPDETADLATDDSQTSGQWEELKRPANGSSTLVGHVINKEIGLIIYVIISIWQ